MKKKEVKKNTLLSVVIILENNENTVSACIDSILNQSYSNLELILVDMNSTDDTGKICDNYLRKDYRVKVLHVENEGVVRAKNMALEMVHGEYFHFCYVNGWMEENAYERIINQMELCNADAFFFDKYIDKDGIFTLGTVALPSGLYSKEDMILYTAGIVDEKNKLITYGMSLENKVIRTTLLKEKNGDINFNEELEFFDSAAFLVRALKNCRKGILDPSGFFYQKDVPLKQEHSVDSVEGVRARLKALEYIQNEAFGLEDREVYICFREAYHRICSFILSRAINRKNRDVLQFMKDEYADDPKIQNKIVNLFFDKYYKTVKKPE